MPRKNVSFLKLSVILLSLCLLLFSHPTQATTLVTKLSNIKESEFLNKYTNLKPGFGDLSYDIKTDKPVLSSQTSQIKKVIVDSGKELSTNYEVSGVKVRTEYKESDGISMATGNKPIK